MIDPREVERDPFARADGVDSVSGALDRPDPNLGTAGLHDHPLIEVHGTIGEGARHDRATARRGEHPVDPEPGPTAVERGARRRHHVVEGGTEHVEPAAGHRRHGDDRGRLEERALHALGHLEFGERQQVVIDEVGLREGDHPVLDPEQVQDPEMFLRLRLPPFARIDDEQAGRHTTHPGQHVAEEADMTRHVDEAHRCTRRQRGVGEAEVDGQAPPLLLLQPVGVGAGQRQHERRLPVVDVPGGGDDRHRSGAVASPTSAARTVSTITSSSAGSTARRSSIVTPSRTRAITGRLLARSDATRSPRTTTP